MISVFLTSIRPQFWPRFYASVQGATTRPFEVVVTSPNDDLPSLPSNFKVVKTGVKPAQALEVAARACQGDLIMGSVDDLVFDSGTLDLMAEAIEANPKVLASGHYAVVDTYGTRREECYHAGGAVSMPGVTPLCPMMRASDWKGAGGTDPYFCVAYGYDDLVIRLQVQGWQAILVDRCVTELKGASDLWLLSGHADLHILRSMWCVDGKFTGQRSRPSSSYTDMTLLTENQGEVRGSQATRWR
jgi:hypothetical protein